MNVLDMVSIGAISGMVGICAGQPLDTIRVRMQQKKDHSIPVGVSWQSGAKNGVRDLFRGMSYPLSTIALQVNTVSRSLTDRYTCRLDLPPSEASINACLCVRARNSMGL